MPVHNEARGTVPGEPDDTVTKAVVYARTALEDACRLIECGDERLLASDGPAGGRPPELSLPEWRKLYVTLDKARKRLWAIASRILGARGEASESRSAELDALKREKDGAYHERNQVVAALAKLFPAGVARTAIEGWSEDWHGCVYIDLPTGQVSWHFHDSEAEMFAHLPPYEKPWDGHDTPEKYRRLAALASESRSVPPRCGFWGELERRCVRPSGHAGDHLLGEREPFDVESRSREVPCPHCGFLRFVEESPESRSVGASDEIAWLVEGQGAGAPLWWTGEWWPRFATVVNGPLHSSHAIARSTDDMEPVFSPEHLKAIRFSRKEDAERAIKLLPVFYRVAVKAVEHMWVAALDGVRAGECKAKAFMNARAEHGQHGQHECCRDGAHIERHLCACGHEWGPAEAYGVRAGEGEPK